MRLTEAEAASSAGPSSRLGFDEFTFTVPKPVKFYLFATSVDLQAPAGYVLRTEPHPRFFTDTTGTVPLALCSHVRTLWWAKKLFVAFKVPPPGQRHIFRKGEPYVQILFVSEDAEYVTTKMSPEEEAYRAEVEQGILLAKSHLAQHVWHNTEGLEFNDHYRVLARAFEREGQAGVATAVHKAVDRFQLCVPRDKTMVEYLDLASQCLREGKYVEAKQILSHTKNMDLTNPEVANRNAILAWRMGLHELALQTMNAAVILQPQAAVYRANLGDLLEQLDRHKEAEAFLRSSLTINPHDAQALSNLGLALAGQERVVEGLDACRAAVAMDPRMAITHFRLGKILAHQRAFAEAQAAFQAALAIDPNDADAQHALKELATGPVS